MVPTQRRSRRFGGRMPWTSLACCKGRSELFFPRRGERPERRVGREARAKALCAVCAVAAQCRTWARTNREFGFWGGESEEERIAAGFQPLIPVSKPEWEPDLERRVV